MGNVPFLAFPSFSNCTRYEHSIGVCHLAELAAKNLEIETRDRIELMIACLYHDVATPPFAHAVEEVFEKKFGFDHEQHLHDLLTGRTSDPGRERAQIFQGRGLKLQSISQSQKARELGLDIFRIGDLAIGKGKLGSLVKSTVDLDNIDNITRAASAIGIRKADGQLAESLAKSFVFSNGEILLSETALQFLEMWQRMRHKLYSMIYADVNDFSLETMIKHAIRILVDSNVEDGGLRQENWCLTEEELIHSRLMQNPKTKEIVTRMRFGDTYYCLAMLSFLSHNSDQIINTVIPQLKKEFQEFFRVDVIANYFIDRRWRSRSHQPLHHPLTTFTSGEKLKEEESKTDVIVGIFTPDKSPSFRRFSGSTSDFNHLIPSSLPTGTKVRFLRLATTRRPEGN